MTQIGLNTSTNYEGEQNALIEELGTSLTVNFELDEAAPEGGLKVFVDSDIEQIVSRLDLPGFAFNPTAENINPNLFGTSFDNSGFFLTIDEGATTASFTIDIFDNEEPDTTLPETFDGLVEANFSLVAPGEVEEEDLADVGTLGDYIIDSDSASSTILFADVESQLTDTGETLETPTEPETPETDDSGLPLVSLNTGPDYLVEEDGTVSAHVFNVTGATIPEDGLVVSVNAPELGEFDLDNINVSEGGEIVDVREDGFDIRLTDFTVLIDLPVAADGETEELETASFTLEAGDGYEVNEDFGNGDFTIADTTEEVPANTSEPNDIIPLASETGLSPDNPEITITETIDFEIGNRYQNEDGSFTYVDATEDVDIYSFDLTAGDTLRLDIDARQTNLENSSDLDTILRVFDGSGNELAISDDTAAPGEAFVSSSDSYLEFEPETDGTYYLGVSGYPNGVPFYNVPEAFGFPAERWEEAIYDPFTPASGNGSGFPEDDFLSYGEYDLTIDLNPDTFIDSSGSDSSNNDNEGSSNNSETQSDEPTVSLGFLTGTTVSEIDDTLINSNVIEGLPNQSSFIALTLETEGEIPEEGVVINVNSDVALRDYVTNRLNSPPFTPGAEIVDAIADETGRETGFQLRIFEPNTFITLVAPNLLRQDIREPETDGPEDVTFFLESGEGYTVESDASEIVATYYDSFEQAPEPSVVPEVSFSISETEIIESEGTQTTLNFSLSEPPPEEGVLVYVTSPQEGALPQFEVLDAEVTGGVYPIPDGGLTSFYFKITEPEASITLPVFEDPFDEGLQGYSLALQEAPGYTIDEDAGEVSYTISDTPDSVVEVSLSSESSVLVESENATSTLTFNLTAAPTTEGITVSVDAPDLSEFDESALTVTGGEITEITDSGFSLNITDVTATVELPLLSDDNSEGETTATFSLVETTNSTINPEANEVAFTLYDTPEQIPLPASEIGSNDTIPEALETRLSSVNPNITINGSISSIDPEEYEDDFSYSAFTEDVDLYAFELNAGDTIAINVDAVNDLELTRYDVPQSLDSELRLFDGSGNELKSVNNAAAPDEEFSRDPYLEFTAESAGSYYVGVSQLGNDNYDPFVEESGSGWIFPEIGVFAGEYELNMELTSDGDGNGGENPEQPTEPVESTFESVFGSLEVDTIEIKGSDQLIFAGSMNDLVDATTGEGDNRIYARSGDDTLILGESDRILAGAGDDAIFTTRSGDNTITGGAGADQFWIASAELPDSANTITDFTSNEDVIGIAGLGIGFDDVSITGTEGDALISTNGSDLAILQGVAADSLSESDFAFA